MYRGFLDEVLRALGLLCGLALVVASAANAATAAERINIATAVSWPAYAFWEIIKTQNLAPDLELEVTILNDPVSGYAMLSSDQFQVYNSTIDYAPIAAEQDLPIRQITLTTISNGVDHVMLAPDITTDQLKGKRAAAPEAFVGQLMVGYWLIENGISIDDVTWVNLNADEAAGAMLGGDIALAYMYEPWTSKVVESLPGATIIAKSNQPLFQKTGMIGDAIYMNETFINEHRETAVKLMRAYWDAVQWWKDHPAEANEIITKHLDWPIADTEFVLGKDGSAMDVEGVYPYTYAEAAAACGVTEGAPPFGLVNGQIFKAFEIAAARWKDLGMMTSMPPADQGIDCSIMGDLAKSGYTGQP